MQLKDPIHLGFQNNIKLKYLKERMDKCDFQYYFYPFNPIPYELRKIFY